MADAPQDWKAGIPEDIRGHESLKDFKDAGALAKSYIETKAMVGQSMRLPGPEASAEERAAFVSKLHEKYPQSVYVPASPEEAAALEKQIWAKLGRPDDANGYSLEGVDLGGVELPVESLAKAAADLGMTKAQFQALARRVAKEQAEAASASKAAQDALKKEWGAAHGEKLSAAAATAAKLGFPARVVESIKAGRLSLEEAKAYDALTAAVGGSGRQVGDQGSSPGKLTPEEAKIRLSELGRNPAFWNGSGPEHDALVAKQRELMEQAYPDLKGQAP